MKPSQKKVNLLAKMSSKNVGREITLEGKESTDKIAWISADGTEFRVEQGEGIPVIDYSLSDIKAATELTITI